MERFVLQKKTWLNLPKDIAAKNALIETANAGDDYQALPVEGQFQLKL
jgi:hypothetical protein